MVSSTCSRTVRDVDINVDEEGDRYPREGASYVQHNKKAGREGANGEGERVIWEYNIIAKRTFFLAFDDIGFVDVEEIENTIFSPISNRIHLPPVKTMEQFV